MKHVFNGSWPQTNIGFTSKFYVFTQVIEIEPNTIQHLIYHFYVFDTVIILFVVADNCLNLERQTFSLVWKSIFYFVELFYIVYVWTDTILNVFKTYCFVTWSLTLAWRKVFIIQIINLTSLKICFIINTFMVHSFFKQKLELNKLAQFLIINFVCSGAKPSWLEDINLIILQFLGTAITILLDLNWG